MNMLIKIAWRNIWRNSTRSLVVILSLVIGIWATVFILAVSDSLHAESLREGIEYKYGHIQIHTKAYKKRPELGNTIPQAGAILETLQADPQVKAATARMLTAGMIASAGYSSNVEIRAVVPESEEQTTLLKTRLSAGNYLDVDKRNPIILGEKLAKKLKVDIGHKVVLTFESPTADLISTTFRLVGTFTTTQVRDEETMVFIRLEDLTRLADMEGQANEIVLKLNDPDRLDAYLPKLQSNLTQPEIVIEDWQQAAPDMAMVSDMIYQMDVIVTTIVLIVLAFGILNTMLMVVLERFKELGILMAVGMNKLRVFAMIFLETLLLSLVGGIGGMALGFITIRSVYRTGINLSLFSEGLSGWGFQEVVHPELALRVYLLITAAVIITAVLASIYPALRALSLNPAEAIRKEV
ncbi:MAG: ABC transporter permease [Lewinella sp.]|nr:ABC transporter permease [Lewinella sp.]